MKHGGMVLSTEVLAYLRQGLIGKLLAYIHGDLARHRDWSGIVFSLELRRFQGEKEATARRILSEEMFGVSVEVNPLRTSFA